MAGSSSTFGNANESPRGTVGLVGTGLFGTALGERLLACGFQVRVHNRTPEKAQPLIARGAQWSEHPACACERIIFCLYTSDLVSNLLERVQANLRPGQIIVDTSTSDPQQTAALGKRLAEQGIEYLEAPFSGSSEQARNREATAIVAGSRTAFDACSDLWDCLAAKTFFVGAWGNAARMKLVTNVVLGLNRAVLAEGLVFARAIGLSQEQALQVLLDSPAYSRIMNAKGPKMVLGDFAPEARLAQHIKDVRLILEEAERGGVTLPLSSVHLELLKRAEAAGLGDLDNSAIIQIIEELKSGKNSER